MPHFSRVPVYSFPFLSRSYHIILHSSRFLEKNAEICDTNVQAMGKDAQECERNMTRTIFSSVHIILLFTLVTAGTVLCESLVDLTHFPCIFLKCAYF